METALIALRLAAVSLLTIYVNADEDVQSSVKRRVETLVEGNKLEFVLKEECTSDKRYSTPLPSRDWHCRDMSCLDTIFSRIEFFCPGIDNQFLCSFVYPRYHSDRIIRPCRQYCKDVFSKCDEGQFYMSLCDKLIDQLYYPTECLAAPAVSECPTVEDKIKDPDKFCCTNQTKGYCLEKGFDSVLYKDGSEKNDEIEYLHKFIVENCGPLALFYKCGTTYPKCQAGVHPEMLPCPEYCDEVANCPLVATPSECESMFAKHKGEPCLDPDISVRSDLSLKRTFKTFVWSKHLAVVKSSQKKCLCQPFNNTCSGFLDYNSTFFPNPIKKTQSEANNSVSNFDSFFKFHECYAELMRYICQLFFPKCSDDLQVYIPCFSFCKEIVANCTTYSISCDTIVKRLDRECQWISVAHNCIAPPHHVACRNKIVYIPESVKCDGNNDCGDWSDENNCDCNPELQWKCNMGMCIPKEKKCDNIWDCPDKSDEKACTCIKNQHQCPQQSNCYFNHMMCDGKYDCRDGYDESNCGKAECTPQQWSCEDGSKCISLSERCDGKPDCLDRSDERKKHCFFLSKEDNRVAVITRTNQTLFLCAPGLTIISANEICKKLGHTGVNRTFETDLVTNGPHFQLSTDGDMSTVFGKGRFVNTCRFLNQLECMPKSCGHSPDQIPPANIESAALGTWPWMAYIEYDGYFICGASIIGDYIIITAAHCVHNVTDKKLIRIATGTTYLYLDLPFKNPYNSKVLYSVVEVMVHPGYNPRLDNSQHDIALLVVDRRIKFNNKTQPLCLPGREDVFSHTSDCFMAGWGRSSCNEKMNRLRQRKVTLFDVERCNSSELMNGTLRSQERCAPFYNGFVEIGKGDTGNPVFCNDEFGTFKLVGITSSVEAECMETTFITFPAIQSYIDWIQLKTKAVFKCNNRHVLVHHKMTCNNFDDCGDNSDEVRDCDVNFNCSFDSDFLCGYQISGGKRNHFNSGGDPKDRIYPLFDHTWGNSTGYWVSLNKESYMKSPMVNLSESHCVQFFYHTRKYDDLGAVIFHFDGKNMTLKLDIQQKQGMDRWLMGKFDVDPGPFQMFIRSYQDVFSVDDIKLLQGSCESIGCFDGQFECQVNGKRSCLPDAVKCNIIIDCDDAQDERFCQSVSKYDCDFENGNLCGFVQSDEDDNTAEWDLIDSRETKLGSNLQESGSVLRLTTSNLKRKQKVTMKQKLHITHADHCLRFYYASSTTASLRIYYDLNSYTVSVLSLELEPVSWKLLTANLSLDINTRYIYYEVVGNMEENNKHLLLANVSITRGLCSCPRGQIICRDDYSCKEITKICDGTAHCHPQAVRHFCDCRSDEFKCKEGQKICIPLAKKCDRNVDCPGGADEGSICDIKKNVSCDFEDPYLCGYRLRPDGYPKWKRVHHHSCPIFVLTFESSPPTRGTKGSYMMVEHREQFVRTAMDSIVFNSSGFGIAFSFFAYNPKPHKNDRNTLALRYWDTKKENKGILWSFVANKHKKWKSMCVSLPKGEIHVSFMSTKTKSRDTFVAIDNIRLIDSQCPVKFANRYIQQMKKT